MSLDYPFYEDLKRRKHKAAKWWLLGDLLYYLGLLPGLLSIPASIIYLILKCLNSEFPWRYLLYWFLFLILCLVVFYTGAYLKRISYQMAKKDGIDANNY